MTVDQSCTLDGSALLTSGGSVPIYTLQDMAELFYVLRNAVYFGLIRSDVVL